MVAVVGSQQLAVVVEVDTLEVVVEDTLEVAVEDRGPAHKHLNICYCLY